MQQLYKQTHLMQPEVLEMVKIKSSLCAVQNKNFWYKPVPGHVVNSVMNLAKVRLILLFFSFCFLGFSSSAQYLPKRYVLPGFIQLNDTLFIAETETDIREYGRFLTIWHQLSGNPDFLLKALPSPIYLGWTYWDASRRLVLMYADEYTIGESSNPNKSGSNVVSYTTFMADWPVVNITKQQANLYCDFRTKDYDFFYKGQKKKKRSQYPPDLVFRLPTQAEWMMAASALLDTTKYKYGVHPNALNPQNDSLIVSAQLFAKDSVLQGHPFSVNTRHQNQLGIYNMCGNVSELVGDSEFVFGGSFADPLKNCTAVSKELCEAPKNNVGFRVVAVIRTE